MKTIFKTTLLVSLILGVLTFVTAFNTFKHNRFSIDLTLRSIFPEPYALSPCFNGFTPSDLEKYPEPIVTEYKTALDDAQRLADGYNGLFVVCSYSVITLFACSLAGLHAMNKIAQPVAPANGYPPSPHS